MSPLLDMYDERIFTKVDTAIHSIVRGSLVIGLIQGILTGVGFWVAGIPNPALWGSVAAIAAFIPGVGTSLVLGPGIIYLFITGSTVAAVGLLAWAVFAVGLIDNFLSAHLVQRGVAVHPFIILLSVLGGLAFFGPIGFILGPLVIAFLIALLDIYRESYGVR
jgi:predicted PurR-regulated permease PerM